MSTVALKMQAGRETALADFRSGKLNMPHKHDCKPWASGYRLAVQDLAGTFGKDAIRAAGGECDYG